jgi:hypothetical protein
MTTIRTGTAFLVAAILAGSLLSVSGMASVQPALAVKAAEAPNHGDPKDAADPNFDIKNVHSEGNGKLVMEVFGQAGGTVPPKPAPGAFGHVFVYAFITDNGIMVINAHWECHEGPTGCDPNETHVSEWHAEFVTLGNVAGHDNPCVTSIYGERTATMDGHKAIVIVPEVKKILKAQTAAFDIQTNPDNPTQECIAEFHELFDET